MSGLVVEFVIEAVNVVDDMRSVCNARRTGKPRGVAYRQNPRKETKRRKRTGRVGVQKERVKSGMKYFKSWCKSLPCRVYMIDAARSDALDQS